MSKQQYRSEIGIISDILRVVMNCGRQGAIISYVTRSVNLSHYYTAIKKCQKLMNLGLMESSSEKRDHIYIITEKGLRFFHEMQKFIAIAQEVKIRY